MKFSNRINSIKYSNVRNLVPYIEAAQNNGIFVHEMHIGQPNIITPREYINKAKAFDSDILKYTNSLGIQELLDAFARVYKRLGLDVSSEDILITQGGSEALTFAISTICDEGDEVLLFEPFYSNYDSFLKLSGAKLVTVELKIENEYALPSKEEIISKITPRTKAILVSNPSNPLGSVFSEDEMNLICEIALEKNIFIISDEVYRYFIYENTFYKSFLSMSNISDRVVIVDSISKHYSACGGRIGTLVSKNKEFISQTLKLCQARLSVSTIDQISTVALLDNGHDHIMKSSEIYKARRDVLCECLNNINGITCVTPKSSLYAFVKLPVDDTDHFAEWLLKNFVYNGETLSFATGSGFYANPEKGKEKARFSFCASTPEEIIRAMKVLEKGIEEYNKSVMA